MEKNWICILAMPQDRDIALRLLKSLKRYHLPGDIRLPDRRAYRNLILYEVREGDLAAKASSTDSSSPSKDSLDNTLLERSRFLLLICSPDAKNSPAFLEKMRAFKSLPQGNNIIPVLVRGEPYEAMPGDFIEQRLVTYILPDKSLGQRLETIEPIAADLRPQPLRSTKKLLRYETVRIAASVLGLHPNYLERRQEKRERRMVLSLVGLIALFCIASSALLLRLGYQVKKEGDVAKKQLELTMDIMDRTMHELPASFADLPQAEGYVNAAVEEAQKTLQDLGLWEDGI